MIDWFVLLVPLAALPIVALFGFVGCQLIWPVDDYPIGPMLQLPEGLGQTVVDSIEVTITVTGENGESSFDTQTRDKADLLAGKESFIEFFIPLGDIDAEEEGSARCHCSLFFADQLGGATLKRDHDSPAELFVLTFIDPGEKEDDFFLA
jgi:hypothetical protein